MKCFNNLLFLGFLDLNFPIENFQVYSLKTGATLKAKNKPPNQQLYNVEYTV